MNALKALLILATGLMMTLLVFPWLDALRGSIYHPTTPERWEYVSSGDDVDISVASDNWAGQSFTVTTQYVLTSVKVLVWRTSTPGTLTVALYNADGSGFPTGAAIDSATISTSAISAVSPGEWESVSYRTTEEEDLEMTVGTYVIVLHYSGTGAINWRAAGGLTGYCFSTDGGSSWSN